MADVIIFDDDPSIGDLAREVLRGLGLTVEHYLSAAGAAQIIQDSRPRVVVLDIMMQGADGLSVCRAIKANPATGHVKVMIVTSKNFPHEKERALRYGADAFLAKPFQPEGLARGVAGLIGLDGAPAQPRGDLPVALTLLDGGAVLEAASLWVFLDGGELAAAWAAERAAGPGNCWILISRYMEDNLSLLRAGGALLGLGCPVRVAGPDTPEGDLQLLAPGMSEHAAAASYGHLPLLFPQREGEFALAPGVVGAVRYTRFPGVAVAYGVDFHGRRVVYCPWHQFDAASCSRRDHEWEKFRSFFQGADILIHGCQAGCGPWESVVDMALAARVKRLILLPCGDERLAGQARDRAASGKAPLDCPVVATGQRLVL
ncbi:MAG TPA: hypothetical protein DEB40_02745 [Elusimicrobia bacterium]|nr:hypothetical protein [Elusimicrobiota bacterium]HBT60648.1 hypothetical protein [Elusimicrobiota bacterium]